MNAGHLRRTAHPDPSSGFWSPNRRQNVAPGADFDLARDNSVYYVLNLVGFTAFAFAGREITRTMSDDRKLTFEWVQSLSSLFKYLRDKHAIKYNPAKDVQRPRAESGEGKTPAIADLQARKLLDASDETRPSLLRQGRLSDKDDSTRNKRDRAILSTLLFHGLRREELCKLKVRDFQHVRKGVPHLKIHVKGGKIRYVPLHPGTNAIILGYLDAAGHGADENGALFRPVKNNRTTRLDRLDNAITPHGIYKLVKAYSAQLGFEIGPHSLRATAATNALDHNADIKKVKDWLGHAHISTTEIYDHRRSRPEDSPTFKVSY